MIYNAEIWDRILAIIRSDLPIGTRNSIAIHYLLPSGGNVRAPIELPSNEDVVGGVDRPDAEEIEIENNPRLKAEYQASEKLMK